MARATDTQERPARSRKRLILLLVWLCGVSLVWWHLVLPVPERVIRHEKDLHLAGYTADGAIFYGHRWPTDARFFSTVGPFQTVDVATGALVSEFGNADDMLQTFPEGVNFVAIQSEDRLKVIDIPTGRTVLERPSGEELQSVRVSDDGELFAIGESNRVSVFQNRTGKLLWSKEIQLDAELATRFPWMQTERIVVMINSSGHFRKYLAAELYAVIGTDVHLRLLVDRRFHASTGEPEFRFGEFDPVIQSPDGRHVAFDKGKDCVLFSIAENREVCRFLSRPVIAISVPIPRNCGSSRPRGTASR